MSMNNLPVFFYHPTVVCIDDDQLMVDSLTGLLGGEYLIKTFTAVKPFLDLISLYKPYLSDALFLRNFSESEFSDRALYSVTELKIDKILDLVNDDNKYADIAVLVTDYLMPEVDGYELCKRMVGYDFKKFLLTGNDDYRLAINAMNDKTINYFVNKNDRNLKEEITTKVEQLVFEYFNTMTLPIRKHLETEHQLPVSDSLFNAYFINLIKAKKIKEYYLIDKNGSMLLVDRDNKKSALVIHTDRSLNEFLLSIADEANAEEIADKVKSQKHIPWFGIGNGPESISSNEWEQNLYAAELVNGKNEVFYVHHKML